MTSAPGAGAESPLEAEPEPTEPHVGLSSAGRRIVPWLCGTARFSELLDATIVNTAVPTMATALRVEPLNMGLAQKPRVVAGATLDALGRVGTVRPGWLAKLLELSLKLPPRWGRVRMMAIIMAGMTKRRAGDRGHA